MFFFEEEGDIQYFCLARGLGDVYKRVTIIRVLVVCGGVGGRCGVVVCGVAVGLLLCIVVGVAIWVCCCVAVVVVAVVVALSLIHI